MGYDFAIRQRERTVQDGLDHRFRLNVAGMDLMRKLLDEQGALDFESEPIRLPVAKGDDDDSYDRLMLLWQAEQDVRLGDLPTERVRVPVVKFESNENWLLNANECRKLAQALRAATVEQVKTLVANDEDTLKDLRTWADVPELADAMEKLGEGREPPSIEEYGESVYELSQDFAAYCERAAEYGGFRVL